MNKKNFRFMTFIIFALGATLGSDCESAKLKRCVSEYDVKCTRDRDQEVKKCTDNCNLVSFACGADPKTKPGTCIEVTQNCKKACYNSRGWEIPDWMKIYY